jgi:hypothetical protein
MRFNSEDQRSRWDQDKKDDDKRDGLSKRIVPNPRSRHPLMLWIIVSFIIFMGLQLYFQRRETRVEIPYTRFVEEVEAGNLARADVAERHVEGELVLEKREGVGTGDAERCVAGAGKERGGGAELPKARRQGGSRPPHLKRRRTPRSRRCSGRWGSERRSPCR